MATIPPVSSFSPSLLTRLDPQRLAQQAQGLQAQVGVAKPGEPTSAMAREWQTQLDRLGDTSPKWDLGQVAETTRSASTLAPAGTSPVDSLGRLATDFIGEVDKAQDASATEVRRLMTGESDNVHQAMIAMRESGLAFSMMVEVRNKLVESFQELMRLQV